MKTPPPGEKVCSAMVLMVAGRFVLSPPLGWVPGVSPSIRTELKLCASCLNRQRYVKNPEEQEVTSFSIQFWGAKWSELNSLHLSKMPGPIS